jgi:peptidoglycan/xylan/chitin deacetylase (PgdA/CDA1 family)
MSILTDEVGKRGYHYYDWNVDSDDAGSATTSDEVYNNVISSLKDDYSIVLQHDIKGFSVDAVERIIQYGLSNGYTFRKLSPTSPKAHHRVFN